MSSIDRNGNSKSIEQGLQFTSVNPSSFSEWKVKEVGLQLVLFGLAELQALRIQNLSSVVYTLENAVFDKNTIKELEPRRLLEMYQLSISSLNDSSNYVKNTLKTIDWTSIEAHIQTADIAGNTDKEYQAEDLTLATADIIKRLRTLNPASYSDDDKGED